MIPWRYLSWLPLQCDWFLPCSHGPGNSMTDPAEDRTDLAGQLQQRNGLYRLPWPKGGQGKVEPVESVMGTEIWIGRVQGVLYPRHSWRLLCKDVRRITPRLPRPLQWMGCLECQAVFMSDVYVHKNQATAQCRWTGMQGCACGFTAVAPGGSVSGWHRSELCHIAEQGAHRAASHAKHGPKRAKLFSFWSSTYCRCFDKVSLASKLSMVWHPLWWFGN